MQKKFTQIENSYWQKYKTTNLSKYLIASILSFIQYLLFLTIAGVVLANINGVFGNNVEIPFTKIQFLIGLSMILGGVGDWFGENLKGAFTKLPFGVFILYVS